MFFFPFANLQLAQIIALFASGTSSSFESQNPMEEKITNAQRRALRYATQSKCEKLLRGKVIPPPCYTMNHQRTAAVI